MHYWVDGYNFFFRLAKTYSTLKKKEKELLDHLYQAMLTLRSPMTVVFDGREKDPPEPLLRNLLALRIVYTPASQTADNYILDMLDHSPNPHDELVVSSDNELLHRAKQKGARTQTVEAFIQKFSKKQAPPTEKKQAKETSTQFARLLHIFQQRLDEED